MMTFDAIYSKYNKTVLSYLKNRIKDEMVAEELASDVMIKVHKSLSTYDETLSQLNTWIMNIAKNCMIDHFRKRTLPVVSLESIYTEWANGDEDAQVDRLSPLKDTSNNPEEILIENEVSVELMKKFKSLTEPEKTVAQLHFFDGLSYDEVAEQLSMPLGTVKAKLHNARTKMMVAFPAELRK
jgi:RNA polymerase sigma factor (sigma-70 family)